MSRENYDNYDQDERTYHAADDSINSELMEKKDPAVNQHENDSRGIHSDRSEEEKTSRHEDDFDNDANRRTLDEEKAVEDEDVED